MLSRDHPRSERQQLALFRTLPGDLAPRDVQDLMAHPFFSLGKTHRIIPIDYRTGDVAIRVEAMAEHGMATIWDADILIWAASQIVEARDSGLSTSRLMAATPHKILTFIGRGASARDYHRLKAALNRLQSTTIATTLRQSSVGQLRRFSWLNEWTRARRRARSRQRHRSHRIGVVLQSGPRRRARAHDRSPSISSLQAAWSAGFTASSGSTPVNNAQVGGSISAIFTANRPAFQPTNASRTSYATSHAGSLFRGTASLSSVIVADTKYWSFACPIIHRRLCTRCWRPRAIRNRLLRAIGDRTPVLSGTGRPAFSSEVNRLRHA